MLAMVWSTSSGGEHHPLDGSTSMVQWCVCVKQKKTQPTKQTTQFKYLHGNYKASIASYYRFLEQELSLLTPTEL